MDKPTVSGRLAATIKQQGWLELWPKAVRLFKKVKRQLFFKPYVVTRNICGEQVQLLITDLWAESWYADTREREVEATWLRSVITGGGRRLSIVELTTD